MSPRISPYLPLSPHISPHLVRRHLDETAPVRALAAAVAASPLAVGAPLAGGLWLCRLAKRL